MGVDRQVLLRFVPGTAQVQIECLSAVHWDGEQLWLVGDEAPRFERLVLNDENASYGDHRSFPIADFVDLPAGPDDEVDGEGVDRQGDYLWLVGSHSRSRKRVGLGDSVDVALKRLAKVEDHPNRHVLIRIALTQDGNGSIPTKSTTTAAGEVLTSAILIADLTAALGSDKRFRHFLRIPGKDNGLDVEGLVAFEDHLLLGLRGPVLRGWAAILEVKPLQTATDPTRLALGSPPYRTRYLRLGGLGVRDLCRDGDDVLILAGPTMDVDGPLRVYRWRDAAHASDSEIIRGDQISLVADDVPFGDGTDHAEGITLLPALGGPPALLVVYDSPARARLLGAGTLLADILSVPSS